MPHFVSEKAAEQKGWIVTSSFDSDPVIYQGKQYYAATAEYKLSRIGKFLRALLIGLAATASLGLAFVNRQFRNWVRELGAGKVSSKIFCETFNQQLKTVDITLRDGSKYVGQVNAEGLPHGVGKQSYAPISPLTYEGEFQNGQYHGHGKLTTGTGFEYEGEFKEDMKWGKGIQTYPNGDRCEGEFRANIPLPCFQGKITYANGEIYEGACIPDIQPHGGVYIKAAPHVLSIE